MVKAPPAGALTARPSCAACRRPLVAWVPSGGSAAKVPTGGVCFCDRIAILPTRTRILMLQHPRERNKGIGTALMAHRSLPRSRLIVGLDFAADPAVREAARGPDTYVLFPTPDALPVEQLPRDRPITLVVLDGTWRQARKLLRLNPAMADLPHVAFRPLRQSGYLIRKQPAEFCLSTIEALAEVLGAIEPDGSRFERLLDPFHAMVARQRWFEAEVGSSRHRFRSRRARVSPRAELAARLETDWSRLVCIHGEANSWPRDDPSRRAPETVHWIAHRPATNETFEAVVAPRRGLAPATPTHVELSPKRLLGGVTPQEWHRAWREFVRSDDVLVLWGTFYRDLAVADGLPLALSAVDLREEASRILGRRLGTLDRCTAAVGGTPSSLGLRGRGGRRLDALVGALEVLRFAATLPA
jgi:DTW domain-containing protein